MDNFHHSYHLLSQFLQHSWNSIFWLTFLALPRVINKNDTPELTPLYNIVVSYVVSGFWGKKDTIVACQ